MIEATKTATGKANCMLTDRPIPAGQAALPVRISTVQTRQIGLEGLQHAITQFRKFGDQDLEPVRQRWIGEIYNNSQRIDPHNSYDWSGMLLAFLCGAGVSIEQAQEIVIKAPNNEWPI